MKSISKIMKTYKGKNVYITGITGFKGSWLALMLHHLGANVYGIGLNPQKEEDLFHKAKVKEIANVTIGDINDIQEDAELSKSLKESNPDFVFHLAAQSIVSEGYKDPLNTFQTNIMGTVNLHELLKSLKDKNKKVSFLNITTDKVYKEIDKPAKETDELFGYDPYSLSKTCSDMISSCYRNALDLNYTISTVRAGNVIGGGDMSDNRIVPDIIRAMLSKSTLEVRSPNSVRPYQHVFDVLIAYLMLAVLQRDNEEYQGEYNVGPDASQTMKTSELIEKLRKYMSFEWEKTGKSIGKESEYLALDNNRIKAIGWKPFFSTNEKVVKSISEWYNKDITGENMSVFTLKQIEEAFKGYE